MCGPGADRVGRTTAATTAIGLGWRPRPGAAATTEVPATTASAGGEGPTLSRAALEGCAVGPGTRTAGAAGRRRRAAPTGRRATTNTTGNADQATPVTAGTAAGATLTTAASSRDDQGRRAGSEDPGIPTTAASDGAKSGGATTAESSRGARPADKDREHFPGRHGDDGLDPAAQSSRRAVDARSALRARRVDA